MKFIKYFLYPSPGSEFRFYIPLAILIFLLFAGAVAFSIIYDRRKHYDFAFKRLFRKTSLNLSLFGLLFLFLIAVRYERIQYFSMRLWLFLSLLGLGYYIFKIVKRFYKDYPREKENVKNLVINTENRKEPQKYTTSKKKR